MQANKLREPARQPETSAAMKQMDRQVNPALKGQVKTQNPAFAPSGFRKYPYVRPERGTSIVKACLCHNQTKRMTTTAARKGKSVFVRRNTTRLSQVAETPSATHHPTKTKGIVSHPYRSPMTIVTRVAQSPKINGTMVESATCSVRGFPGIVPAVVTSSPISTNQFGFSSSVIRCCLHPPLTPTVSCKLQIQSQKRGTVTARRS
jgi:hypothetical protein